MVVAPGTGVTDCAKLAERLHRNFETTQSPWGTQQLSVTVSIGLATWPMTQVSAPKELVTAADKALYFAKEAGRNQVAVMQGDRILPANALKEASTISLLDSMSTQNS